MNKKKPFNFPIDSENARNRNTRKLPQPDTQRRYQELSSTYMTDSFTDACYKQIQNISKNAYQQLTELKQFPLNEILLSISKKLLMNQLQFLFLGCLLDQLKWQYTDTTIKTFAEELKALTKTEPINNIQYKCIQLYMLLSAYSVKVYLNEDIKIFQSELNQMLPKFQQIFHTWATKFAMSALSTNPKKLNRKYIQTSIKKSQASHQDLNRKVTQLVQTNPTADIKQQQLIKKQSEHEIQQDILPPPPGLYPGFSGGSFLRNDSIPYDIFQPWNRDSFIDFPNIRQPSDTYNNLIPGFGKLQNSGCSDKQSVPKQ